MAVDVITQFVTERPIEVVSAHAADPSTAPSWYANIKSVEWKTEPPLAKGSKLAFVARFLGRELAYTYEVVDYEPGTRLVMRTSESPFAMETTYMWEPDGESHTRMTLRNRGQPSGFSRFFSPFMAFAMRRANRRDLERIKAILESENPD